MDLNPAEIQSLLQDYYQRTFPERGDTQVLDLTPLTEGWESIIYAFKVTADPQSGSQSQNLILRLYPGTDAQFKSQREFEGMQVLHRLGYPVPRVDHLERENSPFGKPFVVMEQIEGKTLWSLIGGLDPQQRRSLITQFSDLFAGLHRLDWHPFVPKSEQSNFADPYHCIDCYLSELHGAAAAFPDGKIFQPIIDWLETRRETVPCIRPAPIHWDFHPANVILRPDGSMFVIDWTQIQVSDPRFDLGWTLLLIGAYDGEEMRRTVLAEYQRCAGYEIEELAFFDVANALKRLGTVMISLSAGADQMGMRPEAVENMRRDFPALRRVYDLMVNRTEIKIPEVAALITG